MSVYYNNLLIDWDMGNADFSSDISKKKSNMIAWMYADLDNTDKYLFNYWIKGWFIMTNFCIANTVVWLLINIHVLIVF